MTYFGIIGENEELVHNALSYLHASDINFHKKNIITFSTIFPERLSTCACLIKRGTLIDKGELEKYISSDTVGVADKALGLKLKKDYEHIKRFKVVELIHTDLEIKEGGTEIIEIDDKNYGVISGYQNIGLYESIDFHKPIGGMGIGMMPSKLALTLINIGIGEHEKAKNLINKDSENSPNHQITNSLTIRDPFCGFGTTNFLANHLGYHTIGSDINPTQAKQNRKRRISSPLGNTEQLGTFLKHDVTNIFKSPIFRHGNIIVSEGRLGHIVTHKTAQNEVKIFSEKVASVYKNFFNNLTTFQQLSHSPNQQITIVITIPTWLKHDISISESITDHINTLGRDTTLLEKPYSREKQLVGRQVLIANFSYKENH